jgi:cytidylate kinase
MAVITISREAGSGGAEIAQNLAGMLGYHLVSWDRLAAMLRDFGMIDAIEIYDAPATFFARFLNGRTEVTGMLNRLLRGVARHGNVVIMGRGGFAALQGFADILHVRIQAPLQVRAMRVVRRGEVDDRHDAEAWVKERDKRRAAFVEFSYRMPWDSTRFFDLVVDTGKIQPRHAVPIIAQASRAARSADVGTPMAGDIEEDPAVRDVIVSALGCGADHAKLGALQPEATAPI